MGSEFGSPGEKGPCGYRWGKMTGHPCCTSNKSNTCGWDTRMVGAGRQGRVRRQARGRRRHRCLRHGKWSLSRRCCGCRCSGMRKSRHVWTPQAEQWRCGGPQGRSWRWCCMSGKRCAAAGEWQEGNGRRMGLGHGNALGPKGHGHVGLRRGDWEDQGTHCTSSVPPTECHRSCGPGG